jgi:ABC-2 type transport system ATP-binding protein
MPEPVIQALEATKRYGEVLGLNAFTASFGPGITGLVGPNGAGKSTLFRVLTGLVPLDAGSIRILGRPAFNTPEKNRLIGYCPDQPALWDWLGPEDFLRTLLEIDGYSAEEARTRTAAALETVDLTAERHRRISTFSKGMRQRVKMAQAIAHDPQVLLLDEPLNGTDPLGRAKLLGLFRKFAAEGRHIIVSSHILPEVERLTTNIVMISNGRAVAQGDVHRIRELLDRYPLTIELETPTERPVAVALAGRPDVSSLQFPGPGRIILQTSTPDSFFEDLPQIAVREGLEITGVRSLDDSLEAVFRLLSKG